jgi:aspartyl-tRNA(Asn)/glutamyl-tRNA(Gln) amidotransferase subunit C
MVMTEAEIRDLAHLARLHLSADEVRSIGPQLQRILGFVEQLSALDTGDVEPMTTALDVSNRWVQDMPVASLERVDALRNAPQSDGEFFLVPPVLGVANTSSK